MLVKNHVDGKLIYFSINRNKKYGHSWRKKFKAGTTGRHNDLVSTLFTSLVKERFMTTNS